MALTTESYRLVEAYYNGDLPPAEEERLRNRIREDADFAADVREWEAVFLAMGPTPEELAERAELRKHYKQLSQTNAHAAPAAVGGISRWWAAAAAVVLAGSLAIWLLRDVGSPQPAPVASNVLFLGRADARLGPESDGRTPLERAYLAYDTLNYAVAAPVLLSTEGVAADSLNLLYGGVARLNLGEHGAAIEALESLLSSGYYGDYLPEINYYLGLAYRAAGREEKARQRLTLAAAEPGRYGTAAGAALEE